MGGARFDSLTRFLIARSTRRGALAALLSGALGVHGFTETRAKRSKGHRKKKKRKRQRQLAPTCIDGIKNGSESDVDCGGACRRCANGRSCLSRNDCASALCSGGMCFPCANRFECGKGASGNDCFCSVAVGTGSLVCHEGAPTAGVTRCDLCPAGTVCVVDVFPPNDLVCYKHCGAT